MFIVGDLVRGAQSDDEVAMTMVKLSQIADDAEPKVASEIRRGLIDKEQFGTKKETTFTVPGTKTKYKTVLTPDQAKKINKVFLQATNKSLESFIKSPRFNTMTAVQQAQGMRRIIDLGIQKSNSYVYLTYGKDFYSKYVQKKREDEQR